MSLSSTSANKYPGENNIDEILDRAETQRITLNELDFLVFKTRQLSISRKEELDRIQALLLELESRRSPYLS